MTVPTGSMLIIRASGKVEFTVATTGGVAEVPAEQRPQVPAGTEEHRYLVSDRGTAVVHGLSEDDLTYAFNTIPDKPPTIALAKDPEAQQSGSLQLNYKMEDDYGVVEAKALFALKSAKPEAGEPHSLFGPPEMALALPQARVKNGVGQTTKDLSDHPWAGAEVDDDADRRATRPTTREPANRMISGCRSASFAQAACARHRRAAARLGARRRKPRSRC